MISKIRNIFKNYKYLYNTNFFLSKIDIFNLLLLSIITLIFSYLVVYFSIPFLDTMLGTDVASKNEFSIKIFKLVESVGFKPNFLTFSFLFIFVIILKSLFDIIYEYLSVKLQYKYMKLSGFDLNKIIFRMNQIFFIKVSSSRILNIYTKELERSSDVISSFFLSINALLQLIIFLAIPLYLNFKFTILFLFLMTVFLSPFLLISFYSYKLGIVTTKVNDHLIKTFTNNLLYSKFIAIHGLVGSANSLFLKSFKNFSENNIKLRLLGSISRKMMQPVGIIALLIPIYYYYGKIEDISLLGGILWSLTRTLGPINLILYSFNTINSQIGAFKNLHSTRNDYVAHKIENGKLKIEKFEKIRFSKVSFSYDDKLIFNDLDIEIKQNEKVAIIGDTGSGKSTFLDLLTNVSNIKSGIRSINNISYRDIDFENFRNKISYVPQSLSILDATVKEYFEFYKQNIKEEEIIKFLNLLGCNDFLDDTVSITNTYLGDKGMKLSGGQKQKIILSAALARNPSLLILDEATNALDEREEGKILDKITESNNALIFVSHKFNRHNLFDKIFKLESGEFKNI